MIKVYNIRRFTLSGFKDLRIRKSEICAKTTRNLSHKEQNAPSKVINR